jgi:hypothetical protein
MVALLSVLKREAATGESVLQQLQHGPDWLLLALSVAVVYASMVPVLAGAKDEDFGWMSVRAEKANGRAAMLGVAALVALEHHLGGVALFQSAALPLLAEARDGAMPLLGEARDAAMPLVEQARDALLPLAGEARDALLPLVEQARDALLPLAGEARDALSPLVGEAKSFVQGQ